MAVQELDILARLEDRGWLATAIGGFDHGNLEYLQRFGRFSFQKKKKKKSFKSFVRFRGSVEYRQLLRGLGRWGTGGGGTFWVETRSWRKKESGTWWRELL